MQELEEELDRYINRAATLDFRLKKANGHIAELEAQRDVLLAACKDLVEDLEPLVRNQYDPNGTGCHPALQWRYERDLESVVAGRAAIARAKESGK
jgi:hypothetical protein